MNALITHPDRAVEHHCAVYSPSRTACLFCGRTAAFARGPVSVCSPWAQRPLESICHADGTLVGMSPYGALRNPFAEAPVHVEPLWRALRERGIKAYEMGGDACGVLMASRWSFRWRGEARGAVSSYWRQTWEAGHTHNTTLDQAVIGLMASKQMDTAIDLLRAEGYSEFSTWRDLILSATLPDQ